MQHTIYQYQEITASMAVTTVSMHYSKVNSNRTLYSRQQFPIREERNVNNVILMTHNEATRTTFVRTRPALHEDEAECYEAEAPQKFWPRDQVGPDDLTSLATPPTGRSSTFVTVKIDILLTEQIHMETGTYS